MRNARERATLLAIMSIMFGYLLGISSYAHGVSVAKQNIKGITKYKFRPHIVEYEDALSTILLITSLRPLASDVIAVFIDGIDRELKFRYRMVEFAKVPRAAPKKKTQQINSEHLPNA